MNTDRYAADFPSLSFADIGAGILELRLVKSGRLNAADADMHGELAYVWQAIDRDLRQQGGDDLDRLPARQAMAVLKMEGVPAAAGEEFHRRI